MYDIKNIIFDLGGVILNLDYSNTIKEFNKLGLFNFEKLYNQKKQVQIFDDFEKGKISPEKFIFLIRQLVKVNIKEIDFINAWNAMLLEIPLERLEFIKKLKKKFKIYLLSNTNELKDFQNCFDQIYYSSEIGMRKPDAECFLKVIQDHHLNAHETLFIDDTIQHVKGARKVGINAILLKKRSDNYSTSCWHNSIRTPLVVLGWRKQINFWSAPFLTSPMVSKPKVFNLPSSL